MNNYINPLIGDMKPDDITPRSIDKFYRSLSKVKSKVTQNRKPKSEYLTPTNIQRIHKLRRSAFNQDVKWELIARNPCLNATLAQSRSGKASDTDGRNPVTHIGSLRGRLLALAINLSFSCSLRIGEMLALTWDCIDISEQAIAENNASLFVNK